MRSQRAAESTGRVVAWCGVPGFGGGDGCNGQGGGHDDGGLPFLRAGLPGLVPLGPEPADQGGRPGDVGEHAQPGREDTQAVPRSPVITEIVPDRPPNTTEIETSHSACVTMRRLLRWLPEYWSAGLRSAASCQLAWTRTLRPGRWRRAGRFHYDRGRRPRTCGGAG
jgi:hypothetical protein